MQARYAPPDELVTHDEAGEFEVRIKARGQTTCFIYDHHPLDVAGWDGHLWPFAFNIEDFRPITGPRPSASARAPTFEGPGYVLCSFVPRLFDYHPLSIPRPTTTLTSIPTGALYVEGDFMSRKGIERASLTVHPTASPTAPIPAPARDQSARRAPRNWR